MATSQKTISQHEEEIAKLKNEIKKQRLNSCIANICAPRDSKKCFLYAVAFHFFQKVTNYSLDHKDYDKLIDDNFNIDGISFPIDIKGVRKFLEMNNNLDLKISH